LGQAPRTQRGLSIVELMVGVTIGLIIVAAATVMMSSQLVENRRLLMEAQIQQDLRAAADIITRDLRRSGYLAERAIGTAPSSLQTLDSFSATNPITPAPAVRDPFSTRLVKSGNTSCTNTDLRFAYVSWTTNPPSSVDVGYSISNGVLMSLVNGSTYALTDGNTMNVTEMCVTLSAPTSERLPCAKLCSSASGANTSCWPTYQVRTATVSIKAEGKGVNSNIKRQVTSMVRLRNDNVRFTAIAASVVQACPI
jgi:type IV pilus assembly protein PilW